MVVAIVGVSGAVGQELLHILQERHFPITELRLFGSGRSAGAEYIFDDKPHIVRLLDHGDAFRGVDIAFVCAGSAVSKEYAEDITRYGAVMIDNSNAFRMDAEVPLVVPEINSSDALTYPRHIIANPNCSTIIMSLPLMAIHRLSPIRRVHVATYQAASGAGAQGMTELVEQNYQLVHHQTPIPNKFPYQLAYNVIPQIDVFDAGDYTREELKMHNETRKIFHSDIIVSATCVRVPTLRCHSEAVWVETKEPLDINDVKNAIRQQTGCCLMDDPMQKSYPMPLPLSGTDDVYVGRLRKDMTDPCSLTFWCVGDQIRKGAALNAIQIAELL